MNLDDTLQTVRDEIAAEGGPRPGFAEIRARHARRQRARVAAGGVALAAVAAIGVVVALPGDHHTATVRPLTSAPPPTGVPSEVPPIVATTGAPSVPASGHPYVVVPQGGELVWTDLSDRTTGFFPTDPSDGPAVNHPALSADGRRMVWATQSPTGPTIETYDLDQQSHVVMRASDSGLQTPAIRPDGRQIAWYEADRGGVVTAPFGTNSDVSYSLLLADVEQFSYDATGALVYLPAAPTTCAVDRRATDGTTTCLVAAQAVSTALGQGWTVAEVHGSGASDGVVLGATGPDQESEIAVVTASGAVQPVAPTRTDNGEVNGGVLLDGATRLAYAAQSVVDEKVLAQPVVRIVTLAGGATQTVARGGDLGFGIAAGS